MKLHLLATLMLSFAVSAEAQTAAPPRATKCGSVQRSGNRKVTLLKGRALILELHERLPQARSGDCSSPMIAKSGRDQQQP